MEYGGLRHTKMMGLQVEMCESAPEGVFVTQQRIDKRNSKFLVPSKKENSCADVPGISVTVKLIIFPVNLICNLNLN